MITIPTVYKGQVRVEVIRDGSVSLDTGWSKNIFLNSGLALMTWGDLDTVNIHVGTGSSVPVPTQTTLDNRVLNNTTAATRSSGVANPGRTEVYWDYVKQWPASFADLNLTEVGLGSTSSNSVWTRALFRDSGGTPVVIPLAIGDVLRITYRVTNVLGPDQVSTQTVAGVSRTVTIRPASVRASGGTPWTVPVLGSPSSGNPMISFTESNVLRGRDQPLPLTFGSGQATNRTNPNPNRVRYERSIAPGTATGSIGSVYVGTDFGMCYQVSIDPPLVKGASDILDVAFETEFSG